MRRNMDVTYIVMNNMTYGLTMRKVAHDAEDNRHQIDSRGKLQSPINPLALALVAGAWIARGYSGEINHPTDTVAQAIEHKGFSLVDVFQSPVCHLHMNMYESNHGCIRWMGPIMTRVTGIRRWSKSMNGQSLVCSTAPKCPTYHEQDSSYNRGLPSNSSLA